MNAHPKPTIGRIVHYAGPGTPQPTCQAAIITGIVDRDAGVVDLTVFSYLGPTFYPRIQPQSAGVAAHGDVFGTWHWPERTDD